MKKKVIFFLSFLLLCMTGKILWNCENVPAAVEVTGNETAENILKDLELDEVQKMLNEMMGEDSFSLKQMAADLIDGKEALSAETIQKFLRTVLFNGLENEKSLLLKLILLMFLAAVFANCAEVFGNGQIGEISFYVVYLMVFILLMNSFKEMSASLEKIISWMTEFMRGLAPAYFMAVSAASGTASAAVFYEGVLILVWMIQWILLNVLLPGAGFYVLLELVNNLSKEDMLDKLAELLNTAVSWGLKTLLGAAVGLQVVRNLVAPVMDSMKRGILGKAAGAIPAVGNAVNMVTELVLTSAVLVRNCLGVAILVVFVVVGAGPVLHYGMLSLIYRLMAAVSQPVSDRRLVGAFSTMGEGCALLLRILFTAEILCMLAFIVLLAGFSG
ncbi:stage III sporulation protein AE [Blautia sp. HCP28S3_G10]|uniref:stage III sporulation protein AE n=1 Tax=Blautia sp. HCP28S3_G10 TaxID=3438908 RepID=UPI003F88A5CF